MHIQYEISVNDPLIIFFYESISDVNIAVNKYKCIIKLF